MKILALRYATVQERRQGENLIFPDDHAAMMPIDYYLWAIRGEGRTIVVDTGFGDAAAAKRGRSLLRHPLAALREAGIDPATVEDVVISHLHWDHAGNLDAFPKAVFHLQDSEMAFSTGRCMCHGLFRRPMDVEDVVATVRHVYAERVRFHDGTAEIAPGITLHLAAGIRAGCRSCACRPRAAGWWWRAMRRISTPISATAIRFRWWWMCAGCSPAGCCARNSPTGRTTSFRA